MPDESRRKSVAHLATTPPLEFENYGRTHAPAFEPQMSKTREWTQTESASKFTIFIQVHPEEVFPKRVPSRRSHQIGRRPHRWQRQPELLSAPVLPSVAAALHLQQLVCFAACSNPSSVLVRAAGGVAKRTALLHCVGVVCAPVSASGLALRWHRPGGFAVWCRRSDVVSG